MSDDTTMPLDLPPDDGQPDAAGQGRALRLAGWLAAARKIAAGAELPGVTADIRDIQARMARPTFRAVILGERGRGKTTLVNRLLNAPAIAVDAHLTSPVVVFADTGDSLEYRRAGELHTGPVTAESWAMLGKEPPDRGTTVRRGVRDDLLGDLDLEIVDTPGVNDVDAEVPDAVRLMAAGADAAILVVSATAALSLTETRFLQDFVIAAKVPHVAIAVSRLDLVEEDRDQVMTHIADRARAISPALAVVAGPHPRDPDSARPVADWLATTARDSERLQLRTEQLGGQLVAAMRTTAQLAAAAADAARLDADTRAAAAEKNRAGLSDELLAFDELRIELRRRHSAAAARFRGYLAGTRERLVEVLRYELYHSSEPRLWWERDLPYRLRRALAVITREYEKSLIGGVQVDLEWLRGKLSERFGLTPSGLDVTLRGLRTPTADPGSLDLDNLRNRRIAYRVGPVGLALLIGTLSTGLFPFASLAASAVGVVFGEVLLRSAVDNQRKIAERHLGGVVDRATGEFGVAVGDTLRDLYDQLLDEAVQQRQRWYADRAAALTVTAGPDRAGRDWDDIARQANQLGDKIESANAIGVTT